MQDYLSFCAQLSLLGLLTGVVILAVAVAVRPAVPRDEEAGTALGELAACFWLVFAASLVAGFVVGTLLYLGRAGEVQPIIR